MRNTAISKDVHRIIDSIEGREDGPLIIAIGGMHGNEKAGVRALEGITSHLRKNGLFKKGRFLAVRGNVAALNRNVRFVDEDMNRIWLPQIIDEIEHTPKEQLASTERKEIKSLLTIFKQYLPKKPENFNFPVIVVDLHSFSAEGTMFGITHENPKNIKLFSKLGVPLVLGIEEAVKGAAFDFYQQLGATTLVFEGGRHEDAATLRNITTVMHNILDTAGCIEADKIPGYLRDRQHLKTLNKNQPGIVRVSFQHRLAPTDAFVMHQGYNNLQPVKAGEVLAHDCSGVIKAPYDGFILMPLYQKQGKDGFFITKAVD